MKPGETGAGRDARPPPNMASSPASGGGVRARGTLPRYDLARFIESDPRDLAR
jgi:hypothetical protein